MLARMSRLTVDHLDDLDDVQVVIDKCYAVKVDRAIDNLPMDVIIEQTLATFLQEAFVIRRELKRINVLVAHLIQEYQSRFNKPYPIKE